MKVRSLGMRIPKPGLEPLNQKNLVAKTELTESRVELTQSIISSYVEFTLQN